jgi:hypothetical protein
MDKKMTPHITTAVEWEHSAKRITPVVDAQDAAIAVIVLTGRARTGPDGFWQITFPEGFDLSRSDEAIISVLATPIHAGPIETVPRATYLVTRVHTSGVAIWSFTAEGVWAPSVEFSWQCTIQSLAT